jgi:transposase
MDNCSIHHDEEIRKLIVDECGMLAQLYSCLGPTKVCCLGARLIYLPPYSPDFNPIEEAFSFIKGWLRRHETEFSHADQLPWLINGAIQEITREISLSWFADCGYVY